MPGPSQPPRRPSGTFAPVPIEPVRATTQTLLAAGAKTEAVAEAEIKLSRLLVVSPDVARAIRDILLHLALVQYQAGEEHRSSMLNEHSISVRLAYWRAAEAAERAAGTPDTRPTIQSVCDVMRTEAPGLGGLPERDVRAILRLFGLATSGV